MPMSPLAALLVALSFVTAGVATAQTDASDPPPEVLRPVKLVEVAPNRRAFERTFFGQVVAPQTVDLAFQVGGRLQRLPIDEGQQIAAGELVAELDLEPFERDLERARVELEQARRGAERTANLSSSNSVSRVEAEDAQSSSGSTSTFPRSCSVSSPGRRPRIWRYSPSFPAHRRATRSSSATYSASSTRSPRRASTTPRSTPSRPS